MKRARIGLVGWGTVGGGVVEILTRDAEILRERCGLDIKLATVVTRDPARVRSGTPLPKDTLLTDRIEAITEDKKLACVVHLVGGTTAAKDIMEACLRAGQRVVTANKALLAEHGDDLFGLAAQYKTSISFEAAVAGGIPVVAALRDGLVANRIESIDAILNGTCNFILTMMEQQGLDYAVALAEAQRLGYAESDPTLDVDGTDTAHKLAILARIAFTSRIPMSSVRVEGIQRITAADITSARTMGARIKLIASARHRPDGIEIHVAPTLVPLDHPLATVARNYNGIYLVSSNAGPQVMVGQGAGALPTASAVVSDVVDVLTGRYQATTDNYLFLTTSKRTAFLGEADEVVGSYARFVVADKPGILAGITQALSEHHVNVLSIHQAPSADGQAIIEVSTQPLRGASFLTAVATIDRLGLTIKPTVCLRRLSSLGA